MSKRKVSLTASMLFLISYHLTLFSVLELDTYNSKMLMVLSLTYYFTEDSKKI